MTAAQQYIINAIIRTEKGIDDPAVKAEKKALKKAQDLYIKAIESAKIMRSYERAKRWTDDIDKRNFEGIDANGQMVYNRKGLYKQIPKQEYAIISSRIMEDNSRFMALEEELPRYGAARSAHYFYVYENFAPGNFGVLKQIKITDANREYIASIEAKIGENNGESIIGSTSELNRVLEVLKNKSRNDSRNNAYDSGKRADSGNSGIPLGKSESDGKRNSQKGNGNKQGVKFSLKDTVEQDVLAKYGNLSKTEKKHFLNIAGT